MGWCDARAVTENGKELAGVATDGTADTLKVDVTSHDEHRVRWHTSNHTSVVGYVQGRVHSLDDLQPCLGQSSSDS
ncbi:hypothetical protein GCM10010412_057670 [Nonomuraea recticatena]|uniref:Uncharacterized protein n=1 Tax=Nonomuraea recticatena TaxID=46178 RepID=A0ABP6ETL9_9ACTN